LASGTVNEAPAQQQQQQPTTALLLQINKRRYVVLGETMNIANARPEYSKQEPQLTQRDRATLHVIECFAKSLKITQDHLK